MGIRATRSLSLKQAKGMSLADVRAVVAHQTANLIFNSEQPLDFLKAEEILHCEDENEGEPVPFFEECLAYRFRQGMLNDLTTFIDLGYTCRDEVGLKPWGFLYPNIGKPICNEDTELKRQRASDEAGWHF